MNTEKLDPLSQIEKAGLLIRSGQIVAAPTETVYGLFANAEDDDAVGRIYSAKGRPADNPLIIHIHDIRQLEELWSEVPDIAKKLAHAFWPGPLSLVGRRRPGVCEKASCGLDTLCVRMPDNEIARSVLKAAGVPAAAPSANISGRPSATTPMHALEDFDGKIAGILWGGECRVGLESTVVDITAAVPEILRPGHITKTMLETVVGTVSDSAGEEERPRSPGMKYTHYAPKAPACLYRGTPANTARKMQEDSEGAQIICFDEFRDMYTNPVTIGSNWDIEEQGRRLFSALREMDMRGATKILIQQPRDSERSKAVINRMHRAAGGNVVSCEGDKYIIGVTGRSGSGKTSFSRFFENRGAYSLDTDAIYNSLLLESADMHRELAARFPEAVRDGRIQKPLLGPIVYNDKTAHMDLNKITHRYVEAEVQRILCGIKSGVIVLDVPLLFESSSELNCNLTVGLLADENILLSRIMQRDGIEERRARERLNAQKPDAYYIRRCDAVIYNKGSSEEYENRLLILYEKISTLLTK